MTPDTPVGAAADEPRTPQERLTAVDAEVAAHRHGRVPGDLRRRQILAAAEVLFVERGFGGASMDELARRVGVSKPVIYEHLGNKDGVFEACVARVADELAADVAAAVAHAGDDDEDRLRAGSLAWFRFIAARRDLWYSLLASGEGPVTDAIESIRARQDRFVAAQFQLSAHRAGVDLDTAIIDGLATAINAAFEALGRWWADHPEYAAEDLAELFTAMIAPGLSGLVGWGR